MNLKKHLIRSTDMYLNDITPNAKMQPNKKDLGLTIQTNYPPTQNMLPYKMTSIQQL